MSFFDKKTEVINIELTQYGKHLLSMGKFKPAYYEFFDNDIIYDSEYAELSETRNNIQERIKNETPYLKPQYVFSGIETNFKKLLKEKTQLNISASNPEFLKQLYSIQQTKEKIYFNSSPLGNSNLDDNLPSFKVFSHTSFISSSKTVKNLETQYIRIPEINIFDTFYETSLIEQETELEENSEKFFYTNPFQDQTRILLTKNSIILEIQELNAKQLGDNFEIELFEVSSDTNNSGIQENYKKLYFSEDSNDNTTVEYYLDINVDQEIDENTLKSLNTNAIQWRVVQEINK